MGYIGKVTDTADNTHLVGSTLYGTCSTATGTTAKVVTCPDYVEEVEGVTIHVHFTNKNTAACTLNVNNKGAHTCVGASDVPGTWEDDSVASFTLVNDNNTLYWYQNNMYWENTDTKNTAGSTNDADKLYLIGAKNQAANPQTYSNSKVYETNGALVADSFNGVQLKTSGITPSGVRVGTSTTYITIPAGMAGTLAAAAGKGVDTSVSSSATNNNVPTSLAVYNAIQNAITGVAEYKGSVSAESDLLNAALVKGWYYVVAMPTTTPPTTSITIGGKTCEAGDMVFIRDSGVYTTSASLADHIDIIQSNIDTLTNPEITTIWNNAVPVS